VAIVGSDGMVEIAVFAGRAAQALGLEAGDELVLSYTTDT
jgi:S-adenosylmethionine hydrolase